MPPNWYFGRLGNIMDVRKRLEGSNGKKRL
jgi:hypothetical protein